MSPLRQTAALLVVIMILTSVAGSPLPEETNNEIDNIIPQVQCAPSYTVDVSAPRRTRKEKVFPSMRANYFDVPRLVVYVKSMVFVPSHNKRGFHQ